MAAKHDSIDCFSKQNLSDYVIRDVLLTYQMQNIIQKGFKKIKSSLYSQHHTYCKRVTSGGAHFQGLAPGQHSYEETL